MLGIVQGVAVQVEPADGRVAEALAGQSTGRSAVQSSARRPALADRTARRAAPGDVRGQRLRRRRRHQRDATADAEIVGRLHRERVKQPGTASLSDPESPLWQHANLLGYNSSKAALNAITLIYARTLRADASPSMRLARVRRHRPESPQRPSHRRGGRVEHRSPDHPAGQGGHRGVSQRERRHLFLVTPMRAAVPLDLR